MTLQFNLSPHPPPLSAWVPNKITFSGADTKESCLSFQVLNLPAAFDAGSALET